MCVCECVLCVCVCVCVCVESNQPARTALPQGSARRCPTLAPPPPGTPPRPHRTITAIYPSPSLLAAAAEAVTGLLRSPSHNLRYVGLGALAGVTRISPKYAVEHQVCLCVCGGGD